MTIDDFRRIALSMPGAEERSHMGHPDFRVKGKIFATLGYPDKAWAMVKLNPEQQHDFLHTHPDSFAAIKGGWGRNGATSVQLDRADPAAVEQAMRAACQNLAKKTKPRT
jgi:hypothetical protein